MRKLNAMAFMLAFRNNSRIATAFKHSGIRGRVTSLEFLLLLRYEIYYNL